MAKLKMTRPHRIIPQLSLKDIARFWNKVNKVGGDACWEWLGGANQAGYGMFGLSNQVFLAHRVSASISGILTDQSMQALHDCDNPRCVRPDHLYQGTQSDNIKDCIAKKRNNTASIPKGEAHYSRMKPELVLRGERIGTAILNDYVVRFIRQLVLLSLTDREIGTLLGIRPSIVWQIKSGVTWKHVR